jgi:ribosomal protein L37AE/L43A
MTIERDIDRAVERARDREWERRSASTFCPECGDEMREDAGVWRCECGVLVEYFGPEEGAPNGGCVVTHMEDS